MPSPTTSKCLRRLADENDEYFLDHASLIVGELEERDYYTEDNVFWVSEEARWEKLSEQARQPQIGVLRATPTSPGSPTSRITWRPRDARALS